MGGPGTPWDPSPRPPKAPHRRLPILTAGAEAAVRSDATQQGGHAGPGGQFILWGLGGVILRPFGDNLGLGGGRRGGGLTSNRAKLRSQGAGPAEGAGIGRGGAGPEGSGERSHAHRPPHPSITTHCPIDLPPQGGAHRAVPPPPPKSRWHSGCCPMAAGGNWKRTAAPGWIRISRPRGSA